VCNDYCFTDPKTGDAGNTPSSQLLCIDGSDKVLLSLIQVRKQQAVFLLKFFCCAHTDSVTQCASFVTIINLGVTTGLASPSFPYFAVEPLVFLRHVEVPEGIPLAIEVGGS
jgi:hypothetical protein